MEDVRKTLIKSIIRFLVPEATNAELDPDQRDAIEVAIQCLETAYNLEGQRDNPDVLNLVELVQEALETKKSKEVTDEDKAKAEVLKTEGNNAMKDQNFAEALEKYTKAIELNPNNAVYFCNRAAALTRLNKNKEAVEDCHKAIKLDPFYCKAFGRLGIAHSNMQNYKEAKDAYARAVELDPNNPSYLRNFNLAQEKLQELEREYDQPSRPFDFERLINNPNVVNIASQMMNDPAFRNVVSDIIHTDGRTPSQNINVLFQAGQQIAAQVEATNPALVETLRRTLNPDSEVQDEPSRDEPSMSGTQNKDKQDDIE